MLEWWPALIFHFSSRLGFSRSIVVATQLMLRKQTCEIFVEILLPEVLGFRWKCSSVILRPSPTTSLSLPSSAWDSARSENGAAQTGTLLLKVSRRCPQMRPLLWRCLHRQACSASAASFSRLCRSALSRTTSTGAGRPLHLRSPDFLVLLSVK